MYNYIWIIVGCLILGIILYYLDIKKSYNSKEKLIDALSKKLDLELTRIEFNDKDEEKQAREDCEAFTAYDIAIEDNKDEVSEYDVSINSPIYEYNYINDKDKKTIDLCEYSNVTSQMISSRYINLFNTHIIAIFETKLKNQRLHIKVDESKKSNNIVFESVFKDYKDQVLKFDNEFFPNYSDVFNRKYNNENITNGCDYDYIELNQNEKNLLLELFKQSKLTFSLAIQNGVGRIRIIFSNRMGNFETIQVTEELINSISNIIISIIKNW